MCQSPNQSLQASAAECAWEGVSQWLRPAQCTYLEGLYEGPQQDADGFSLPEKFDEAGRPEEPQEAEVDEVLLECRSV